MPVRRVGERGYAMAALLVALSVMAIVLSVAMPVWRTSVQREREAELIFRGEQYVQAIDLFSRRNGGYPTSLVALRDGRFIRKLYKDPMTSGDFQPVYFGQVATATPTVPGQGGLGTQPGARGQAAGLTAQSPGAAGRGVQPSAPPARGFGQPAASARGQLGQPGQPGAQGAGPIIGVTSTSRGQALRLYNGQDNYNEWLFVSTAATRQPGAPGGVQAPGMPGTVPGRGGRAGAPDGRGRGERGVGPAGQRGAPGRGFPGRGNAPGPFGRPGGFPPTQFPNPNQPGRF